MFVFDLMDMVSIFGVALLVVLAVISWIAGVKFETKRRKKR